MMCIGIVGTYVGNIFMPVKERPLYIVRTVLNDKEIKNVKYFNYIVLMNKRI